MLLLFRSWAYLLLSFLSPFRVPIHRDVRSSVRSFVRFFLIFFFFLFAISRSIDSSSLRERKKSKRESNLLKREENKKTNSLRVKKKRKDGEGGSLSLVWQHIIAWRAEYGIARDQIQGRYAQVYKERYIIPYVLAARSFGNLTIVACEINEVRSFLLSFSFAISTANFPGQTPKVNRHVRALHCRPSTKLLNEHDATSIVGKRTEGRT